MKVIKAHFKRVLPENWCTRLKDPRRNIRSWKFQTIIEHVMNGMLSGCKHLRELEAASAHSGDRIPDTTVHDLLVQMDPEPLERELARQVKEASRNHELSDRELPIRLTVIDGKALSQTTKSIDEYSINRSQRGCQKYVQMALRAFFASSKLKLHLGQMRYKKTNDRGAFQAFLGRLIELYGKTGLLEVISIDAGITSIKNAQYVVDNSLDYIMALKDQRSRKATQIAIELPDHAVPDRVEIEHKNGKTFTRTLYRHQAPEELKWPGAREIWKLVKESVDSTGRKKIETHYYVTSLPKSRLTSLQVLKTIRRHWSIENNANWVLDTAWKEDTFPWCNKALGIISLFRLLAYNVIARLKYRRLRKAEALPWLRLLEIVKQVLFPLSSTLRLYALR